MLTRALSLNGGVQMRMEEMSASHHVDSGTDHDDLSGIIDWGNKVDRQREVRSQTQLSAAPLGTFKVSITNWRELNSRVSFPPFRVACPVAGSCRSRRARPRHAKRSAPKATQETRYKEHAATCGRK